MSKKRKIMIGVAIVAVGILIGGVLTTINFSIDNRDGTALWPLISELNISEPPPLNMTANVTYSVSLHPNYVKSYGVHSGPARITLGLSEGFICVQNNTTRETNLTLAGDPVTFEWIIKSVKTGNWSLFVEIEWNYTYFKKDWDSHPYGGNLKDWSYIYISVSETSAYIIVSSSQESNANGNGEYNKTIPISSARLAHINISLSDTPTLNQTVEITCKVTSLVDATNTTAEIILPAGWTTMSGNTSWQGSIVNNTQITFSATAKPVITGNFTITGKVENSIFESNNSLYISLSENNASVSDYPPSSEPSIYCTPLNSSEIPTTNLSQEEIANMTKPCVVNITENQTTTLQVEHSGTKSLGFIKIKGYIYYNDPELGFQPAKFLAAYFYDENFLSADELLGGYIVDADGYFESPWILNVDIYPGETGTRDIYVTFKTETTAAKVQYQLGALYSQFTSTYWDVSDGTVDVGNWNVGSHRAFRVYEYLMQGWDYMVNGPADWTPPKVYATWESGHDANFGCGEDWTHYHYGGLWNHHIHIKDAHADSPDVILHEYGHHILYTVYGDWVPPDATGDHWWSQEVHVNLAWTEGWADFFPAPVRGDYWLADYLQDWKLNLEERRIYQISNPTNFYDIIYTGDDVEGNVAAALYDIYDTNNDGCDTYSGGFSLIWCVISSQTDNNFAEFWSAWKTRYTGSYTNHYAKMAIYQNTIDYNNAPTCTISNLGTGWYKGTITLSATVSDTDSEDSSYLQVEFQYSTDHVTWIEIGTDTSSPYSVNWNTGTLSDDSVWVRARAFDGMEYSSWDECDSSFRVDNTPPNTPTIYEDHCGTSWADHNSPHFYWSNPGDTGSGISHYVGVIDDYQESVSHIVDLGNTLSYHPTWADGTYDFMIYAVDYAGNSGPFSNTITVHIDTTPPTTNDNAPSGWQTTKPVTVTLTATDPTPGSGVYKTYYKKWLTTSSEPSVWTEETSIVLDADGIWNIKYKSVDNVGNEETPITKEVWIDTTPPSTTHSLSPVTPDGNNGWYKTTPTVTLTVTEASSGVAYTEYKIGTGSWQTYTSPFSVPDGENTISYYSVDNAGNPESPAISFSINVDTKTPTTTDNAPSGWQTTKPVTITLTATDPSPGSGVAYTYYKKWLSTGTEPGWTVGTIISLNSDGKWNIKYYSVDNAGKTETPTTKEVWIDTIKPTNPNTYSSSPGISTWTNSLSVSWEGAYDATSGIAGYHYAWSTTTDTVPTESDTFITQNSITSLPPSDGSNWYLHIRTRDNAGNIAQSDTVLHIGMFWVDRTKPQTTFILNPQEPTGLNSWYDCDVVVTLSALDTYSDVSNIYYRINCGSLHTYSSPFTMSMEGENVLEYYSIDIAGNQEESISTIIKIDKTPPDIPALSSPANGATIHDRRPTFTWDQPNDPGGSGVGYYCLQIDVVNDFSTVDLIEVIVDSTTYNLNDLGIDLDFTTYYWRVNAVDNAGNVGGWSDAWHFTVERYYSVDLVPDSQTETGYTPGTTVIFYVTVWNRGNCDDTIYLTLIYPSEYIDATVAPSSVYLPYVYYGNSAEVTITATTPTQLNRLAEIVVIGVSQNDPALIPATDTATCNVRLLGDGGGGGGGVKRLIPISSGGFDDGLIDGFDIGIGGHVALPGTMLDGDLDLLPGGRDDFCINRIIDVRPIFDLPDLGLPGFSPHPWYCEANNIYQLYYVNVSNPFNSTIIVNLSLYGVPEAWNAYLSNYSVNLEPGEYAIITLTVVIPKTTTIGQTTIWVLGTIQDYDYLFMYGINVTVGELPVAIAMVESSYPVILENDILIFNGSYSYDPDGTIIGYEWDFGDGTNGTGMAVEHSYENTGNYVVTLIVGDNYNLTNSTSVIVSVEHHSFEMGVQQINTEIRPGETAVYMINIENTGTISDTYVLRMNGLDSSWCYPDNVYVGVSAGGSITLYLKVTVPLDYPLLENTTYDFTITVTCVHDEIMMSNAPLTYTDDETLTVIATKESKTRYMINEVEELMVVLDGMDIQHGVKNSLQSKLENALDKLNTALDDILNGDESHADNMLNCAENKINAFINEVEAQKGKKISEEDADVLTGMAQIIIEHINDTIATPL